MSQKMLLNHQTCHFNCCVEVSMKTSLTQKHYLEHIREIDDCKLLVKTLKRVDYRKPYTNISNLVVLSHINQSMSKHLSNHMLKSKKAIIPLKILRKHTKFVIHSKSRNIYFEDKVIDDKNLYEAFKILASKNSAINNFVYRTGIIDRNTFVSNFVNLFIKITEFDKRDYFLMEPAWSIEWNKIFDNAFDYFDTIMKNLLKKTKDLTVVDICFRRIVNKSHIFGDGNNYYALKNKSFFLHTEEFKSEIFSTLKLTEKSYESLFKIDYYELKIHCPNQIFINKKGYSDIYCESTKTKNYLEFIRILKKLIEVTRRTARQDRKKIIRIYDKYFHMLVQYLDKTELINLFFKELCQLRFCILYDTNPLIYESLSCYLDRLDELIIYCINKSNNIKAAKFFLRNFNSSDHNFWENIFFASLKKKIVSKELVYLYLNLNPERIFEQKIIKLNTMNFMKKLLQKKPSCVLFLPEKFRANKILWKIAVKKSYKVLVDAPSEIKEDKEIIKLASRINKNAIKSSSIKLKSDVKFLQSFCSPREAFAYASEKTKINPKCCVEVLKDHPSDIKLISKRNILKLPFSKFTSAERKKLFDEFIKIHNLKDILETAIYKKTFLYDV